MSPLSNEPMKRCEQIAQLKQRGEMSEKRAALEYGRLWDRLTVKQQNALLTWADEPSDDGR